MTFRFRAAPLLALRRRQLEAAQARFLRANEDVAAAERLLTAAEKGVDQATVGYRDALVAGTEHAALERHRYWIDQQCSAVDRQRHARDECCKVVDIASEALVAAHKQVRMLERLRERARRRHEGEVRAHEMKQIDLLATLQHARRITEGGTS